MKNWNAPEIQELNLSSTEQHGKPSKYIDGAIYDAERNTGWYTFSGNDDDSNLHNGTVIIDDNPGGNVPRP